MGWFEAPLLPSVPCICAKGLCVGVGVLPNRRTAGCLPFPGFFFSRLCWPGGGHFRRKTQSCPVGNELGGGAVKAELLVLASRKGLLFRKTCKEICLQEASHPPPPISSSPIRSIFTGEVSPFLSGTSFSGKYGNISLRIGLSGFWKPHESSPLWRQGQVITGPT